MAKAILFIVASPSKWIWNQKAPRFQSYGESWSPHPVISCCHPDPRGYCTCDPFPWFPFAYTPHTPHPIIAFKVACPLDPAAFFSVLSTVDFLPFHSLCSNNRSFTDPQRCFFLQEAFMDSTRLFCPNQDSPTPVLRTPLPFADVSLVTYH